MSRESLLDDAISKAKEAEDWQLVEWLRMARGGESAARWYSDKLREAHRTERKLLDENAKLRELVRFANKTVEGLCELVENSPGCSMCLLNQDEDRACGAAELFSRMLELGVEL